MDPLIPGGCACVHDVYWSPHERLNVIHVGDLFGFCFFTYNSLIG